MHAGGLRAMLREKYEAPAWALLEEVANGTGSTASRYADAVALSLWPSRGIELHGFEIKVSRQDLRGELANPKKAEAIGRFCDYWWLVLADIDIIANQTRPPAWGVLVPDKRGKLRVAVPATKNEGREAWSPSFVASLFRRFSENTVPMVRHQDKIKELREEMDERIDDKVAKVIGAKLAQVEQDRDRAQRIVDSLRAEVTAFEDALGMSMSAFRNTHAAWGRRLGEALQTLTNISRAREAAAGFHSIVAQLEAAERTARELRFEVHKALDALAVVQSSSPEEESRG